MTFKFNTAHKNIFIYWLEFIYLSVSPGPQSREVATVSSSMMFLIICTV